MKICSGVGVAPYPERTTIIGPLKSNNVPRLEIPYVDGPQLARYFDLIACVHMSGLLLRSHMNAGQDGFRNTGALVHGSRIEWMAVFETADYSVAALRRTDFGRVQSSIRLRTMQPMAASVF